MDGSEDNEMMCIKHDPCEELLTRLQSIEEEDVDPSDDIIDNDIAQVDIADLQIDSHHNEDNIVNIMTCNVAIIGSII